MIVVDPVRHPTAEQADIHLQPFPGSDAALVFAMVHVLARDGLIDRAFLDARVLGWDELEPRHRPLHAGLGRGPHRRAGGADRGGGADLRRRACAPLARPGACSARPWAAT